MDDPKDPTPAAAPFTSDSVSLVRRNPYWMALGASPFFAAFGLIVAAIVTAKAAFLAPLFHLGAMGAAFTFVAYKTNKNPRYESGEIRSDLEGVRFRGELLVARDQIKQGFVVPQKAKGRFYVRLVKKGLAPSVNLDVPDVETGRAILRSLGLDATQTVAEVNALSQVFSWSTAKQMGIFGAPSIAMFAGMAAGTRLFGHAGVLMGVALFFALMVAVMTATLARTKVQIGADGILTRWFGKERFFPFSQIELVNPYQEKRLNKTYVGVELLLRSGELVRILVGQKQFGEEEAGLLVERIGEAIDAYSRGGASGDASILGRNGRAPKDWVTSLRALGAGANADMRTPPIPLERLWRIVEDASASALARASAAIALAPQVAPAERKRIRVAAETTASPKLRIALEHAASRDTTDEELAERLAELEAESAVEVPPSAHHAPL